MGRKRDEEGEEGKRGRDEEGGREEGRKEEEGRRNGLLKKSYKKEN
jgi:hypothetical protein